MSVITVCDADGYEIDVRKFTQRDPLSFNDVIRAIDGYPGMRVRVYPAVTPRQCVVIAEHFGGHCHHKPRPRYG